MTRVGCCYTRRESAPGEELDAQLVKGQFAIGNPVAICKKPQSPSVTSDIKSKWCKKQCGVEWVAREQARSDAPERLAGAEPPVRNSVRKGGRSSVHVWLVTKCHR